MRTNTIPSNSAEARGIPADRAASPALTSLGVPLQPSEAGGWRLDLSELRLFTGLSVVARLIGEEILEQAREGVRDIVVRRRLIADLTPELASLDLGSVSIYALGNVLAGVASYPDEFQSQLRTVFGTLQRPRWGSILFPELFEESASNQSNLKTSELSVSESQSVDSRAHPALLFPFHLHFAQEDIDYYFLVERDAAGRFLRITIERESEQRLNLERIPHRVVDDLDRRTYIQGLTRITESVYLGILRECENARTEYDDNFRRNVHFFEQVRRAGLSDCESLAVTWPASMSAFIVRASRREAVEFLKRVFLVLEDREAARLLHEGEVIEMQSGTRSAFLDLSRLGRCLNVSLLERRNAPEIRGYLERMPRVAAAARERPGAFSDQRIFLIHHITAETLGVIRGFSEMGAARIHTLFVKYAGVVPQEYLETLLALPEERFEFHGLQKVESQGAAEPYYLLSRQYSRTDHLHSLAEQLETDGFPFFDAMRKSAGHLFLREALLARAAGQRIVLVEDGGYLAPDLNRLCREGASLEQACAEFGLALELSADAREGDPMLAEALPDASERGRPLRDWLVDFFPGSVEHTRNGYNRLQAEEQSGGGLAFPALSIAVSNIKRERESEEVSISILHAVESILHGLGLVFSERRALVLGSRGAIGRNLMEDLASKLRPENVCGVDIVHQDDDQLRKSLPCLERARLDELPDDRLYDCDVILGVIGHSICNADFLERLVWNSCRPRLIFASGSTKTMEFTDLSAWLTGLERADEPRIAGAPVRLETEAVRDPQTGHGVARRVRVHFSSPEKRPLDGAAFRDLFLLGGLTPINFLFYGVPTETMDPIMAQLATVSAGLATAAGAGVELPRKLLAVDREIDPDGRLL